MRRWEYYILQATRMVEVWTVFFANDKRDEPLKPLSAWLKYLGDKGWEVISVRIHAPEMITILKREIL